MILQYEGKKTEREIFESIPDEELRRSNDSESLNWLIHTDNLIALKYLITK